MDAPNAMTPTQIVLICILVGMLLAWMVTFAWLALRPDKARKAEIEHMLAMASQTLPVTTAPARLHTLAHAQTQTQTSLQMVRPDTASEVVLERSAEAIR